MQKLIFKVKSEKKLKKLFSLDIIDCNDISPYMNAFNSMRKNDKDFYIFITYGYENEWINHYNKVVYSVKWGGILASGDDKLIVKFKEGIKKLK